MILNNTWWGLPKYFWSGKFWGELGRKLGKLSTLIRRAAKRRKCKLESWAERLTQKWTHFPTGHFTACTFLCINWAIRSYQTKQNKTLLCSITRLDAASSSHSFHLSYKGPLRVKARQYPILSISSSSVCFFKLFCCGTNPILSWPDIKSQNLVHREYHKYLKL